MTTIFLPRWLAPRLIALLGVAAALTIQYGVALADGGEAGLVVQHGDGSIDTYCVGFEGSSISGPDLLAKAGIPVVQFSGLVCALGSEGCFQPSSFDSCACMSFPPQNTYWAFFIERHGSQWQYASAGFLDPRTALRDGDMQAWRWGKGSATNAPAPPGITFEQVCGHAPQGGVQQPTAPLQSTQALATTARPLQTTATAPVGLAPAGPPATESPDQQTVPTPSITEADAATPVIRTHGTATAVPQAPAAGQGNSGGSSRGLISFAAVSVLLAVTIGIALLLRHRRGL